MTPWTERTPIPDWGRCPACGSPVAPVKWLYPSRFYCTKSGWCADLPGCGSRVENFLPVHQSVLNDARKAYREALVRLEENRPS